MIFLDTNTFISLLVNRDSQQTEKVKNLLKEAAGGKIKLITAPLVFFETKWVLRYFYDLDKETLINILRKFLAIGCSNLSIFFILGDVLFNILLFSIFILLFLNGLLLILFIFKISFTNCLNNL